MPEQSPQADKDIIRNAIDFWRKIYDEDVVTIKFVKKDGTIRIMKATLNFAYIPKSKQPKNVDMSKIVKLMQNSGIIHVFDMEKKDWRSVPFERVDWMEVGKERYKIRPFKK